MNDRFAISDVVVRALGWTLTHSIWQGAALALVLLILLPRLPKARQRYLAAYGALMAVLAASAATFFWVFEPETAATISTEGVPTFGPFLLTQQQTPVQTAWTDNLTQWLESHYVSIVLVWLLGFLFFLIRLSTGLWQVHQLQTQRLKPVEEHWQQKVLELSNRLGLTATVRLFESAMVYSPVAIGWLKPVVLFPIGLINRLSPAEVEAVLAHELAHIARRDWLFNLLQAFVEAVFYYHPAVWWVSAVIRRERENCCDDAALAATGNPLIFAKALVQVQELAIPAPRLALGIGGSSRRPLLLERVRRILNQPQQKSQVMEKLTATVILLALLTFIGLRANTPPTVAAAFAQITDWSDGLLWNNDNSQMTQDSVPKSKSKNIQKITREDDNGKVEMELENGQITRLKLDDKEIPSNEFAQYGELAQELQRSVVPPVPPVPPMPPVPPVAPVPPVPPVPPIFGFANPQLSTITDEEGNIVITLEKDGKPMEIKVEKGEVWMNGKKLEKGEKIDLPGMGFHFAQPLQFDMNAPNMAFGWGNSSGSGMSYSFSDEDRAEWQEQMEEWRKHADEFREHYNELRENYRNMSDEDRKDLEKDMKEFEEEWKSSQDEWKREMENWKAHQGDYREQQHQLREDLRNRERDNRGMEFQAALRARLLQDKLISDTNDFSFNLSPKSLKVNGKKQSDEAHKKYMELYERFTGKRMEKKDNYTLEVHN